MSANLPAHQSSLNELRDFHAFVGAQLTATREPLSPEDLIDLWRDQHPRVEEASAVAAAVRAALDDMAAGDMGVPLDEYDRQFRARHGLPPQA
jgi:hypothetical protein